MNELWPAPRATAPIDATVALPGSKSLTNRALVLAALAQGPSLIEQPLKARDTQLMAAGLRTLGVRIAETGDDWAVVPAPLHGPARIDCGLAGTVMRFLPPLAALALGCVEFDGDRRARQRPMAPMLAALRQLRVRVSDSNGGLPIRIAGTGTVRGGAVTIDASASSQFVSALLLVGARFQEGVEVQHDGTTVPSFPHIKMTVTQLRQSGVDVVDSEPDRWTVAPGPIMARDVVIEPDLSTAAPFIAAALATGGQCRIERWPERTDQAGDRLPMLVEILGGQAHRDGHDLVVIAGDRIEGAVLDLRDVGELSPVIAALCALASTPSRLEGIAHLRGHETDRLAAIVAEINALGGRATELVDGLRIEPATLHGGVFSSHGDHRMAHAGAVLGLAVDGIMIDDVQATAKTFPDFVPTWAGFVE